VPDSLFKALDYTAFVLTDHCNKRAIV